MTSAPETRTTHGWPTSGPGGTRRTSVSVDEAAALAADAGLTLVGSRDLSPLQRLRRPRDRVIHAAQPLLRRARGRSLWADSMVGGDALQQSHLAGLLQYRLLRFERPPIA